LVVARGEEVATVFGAALAADGQGTIDDAWARLSLLAEVSDTLIRTLDTGQSADHLARLVVPRLADWATVTVLAEDGADQLTGRAHRNPDRLCDLDAYLSGRTAGVRGQAALAAALRSGQPLRLAGANVALARDAAGPRVQAAFDRLDATSAVIVPLAAHGHVFGALSLINSGVRPPLTDAEVALAEEIARRGSLALDNARLYTRQLQVAETLRRRPRRWRSPSVTGPPGGTRLSAGTSTTPSRSPTDPPCWSSATSPGTRWRRLRRCRNCGARCARWPVTGPEALPTPSPARTRCWP
jgi:transcriptional regulator with GAF, ATPase, and Fis domain